MMEPPRFDKLPYQWKTNTSYLLASLAIMRTPPPRDKWAICVKRELLQGVFLHSACSYAICPRLHSSLCRAIVLEIAWWWLYYVAACASTRQRGTRSWQRSGC